MIQRANRAVVKLLRLVKSRLGIRTQYAIGKFAIFLPANHLLPTYRAQHKQYDAFLPVLARHLSAGAAVIDVGANCGDTVVAMVSENIALRYICIEPDHQFFDFLQDNSRLVKQADARASIVTLQSFIGQEIKAAALVGTGGSKHALVSADTSAHLLQSVTIDDIVASRMLSDVILLKSDVDGYDYDVLDSANRLLIEQQPILFFECQFASRPQMVHYLETIVKLSANSYSTFTVFDNFGAVVMKAADLDAVTQLFEYVLNQNVAGSDATRTIFYFDIATATPKYRSILRKAVDAYLGAA